MSRLQLWWKSVRPFSFTVSVIPPILGSIIALVDNSGLSMSWGFFLLTLIGCVAAHGGANILSDYCDYRKNVDREGTYGSSGILVEKLMTPRYAFLESIVLFGTATVIGSYLVYAVPNGVNLIWLIGAGAFLGFFYTMPPFVLKYRAMGDFAVTLAFGVGMTLGAYFVQAGHYSWTPVLFSIPSALLVDAILHSNNLRDIKNDSVVKIMTLAMVLGEEGAKKMYYALIIGAYLVTVILILFGSLTWLALIVFISLPFAVKLIKTVQGKDEMSEAEFALTDVKTAQFHAAFSLLFIVALLIHYFVRG